MAIATTYTFAYYVRLLGFGVYSLYFTILGWIVVEGEDEVDVAKEVQDWMIMVAEHFTIVEAGPLAVRICTLVLDMFLVSEE